MCDTNYNEGLFFLFDTNRVSSNLLDRLCILECDWLFNINASNRIMEVIEIFSCRCIHYYSERNTRIILVTIEYTKLSFKSHPLSTITKFEMKYNYQ